MAEDKKPINYKLFTLTGKPQIGNKYANILQCIHSTTHNCSLCQARHPITTIRGTTFKHKKVMRFTPCTITSRKTWRTHCCIETARTWTLFMQEDDNINWHHAHCKTNSESKPLKSMFASLNNNRLEVYPKKGRWPTHCQLFIQASPGSNGYALPKNLEVNAWVGFITFWDKSQIWAPPPSPLLPDRRKKDTHNKSIMTTVFSWISTITNHSEWLSFFCLVPRKAPSTPRLQYTWPGHIASASNLDNNYMYMELCMV